MGSWLDLIGYTGFILMIGLNVTERYREIGNVIATVMFVSVLAVPLIKDITGAIWERLKILWNFLHDS